MRGVNHAGQREWSSSGSVLRHSSPCFHHQRIWLDIIDLHSLDLLAPRATCPGDRRGAIPIASRESRSYY